MIVTPGYLTFNNYYWYDGVNRLTAGDGLDASNHLLWAQNFQYDAFGNNWVASTGGLPSFNTTPAANIFTAKNQLNNVSYDAAGNQTTVSGAAVTYDAENRQTQVTEPPMAGGAQANYSYGGLGQLVSKTLSSGTTVYVYDALGRMVAQYSSSAPGTTLCQTCYLSVDQLGSTRLVTDQAANVIARHDYVPFGQEIPATWAGRGAQWGVDDAVTQKFTGQERDAETGSDYFKARYYGNLLGRFTSPDPANAGANLMNPQSWNAYAYVGNNPMNAVDPSGTHVVDCVWDGCGGHPGGGGWGGGGGGQVVDGIPQTLQTGTLGGNSLAACPVSAGAKIPIVPFENSPASWASGVTPTLGTRGGPLPVQGERRGRDQRAQTRRVEHSGDQSADRFRS